MAKKPTPKKTTRTSRQLPQTPVRKKTTDAQPGRKLFELFPFIFLAISAGIVLYTRLRLLAIPLERDEAGFAYIGHWLLHGKSLYTDMVDNKLPGLYILYGLFTSLFGYNSTGVHIGLLISQVASAVCFYFLIKTLHPGRFVAAIATSFFILLAASINVMGFAAHATQLLLPFAIAGWWLFWKGMQSERKMLFLFSGLLFGLAFIIKQQAIVFGLLAALLWWPARLIWYKKAKLPLVEWILLGIGGVIPALATIGYFAATGRFDDLIFWSYDQPAGMAATFEMSRWDMFKNIFPKVIQGFLPVWIAALAGAILIWFSDVRKSVAWFAVFFGITGLASVVIGAAFYSHYFVVALPGAALLAALCLYAIYSKAGQAGQWIAMTVAAILMIIPLYQHRDYFFKPDYAVIHQKMYNQNMFPELELIGKELKKRVPEGERIGILGSEPAVLVAADRPGCSKHLFMYPLLSDPETSPALQQEYISELQACMPNYIVWNVNTGSWTPGYENLQMFKQLMTWLEQHYVTTGIAELRPGLPGLLVWDTALSSYQSQSSYKAYVLKRK